MKTRCLVILTDYFLSCCKLGISKSQVNQTTTQYRWQTMLVTRRSQATQKNEGSQPILCSPGEPFTSCFFCLPLPCPGALVSETQQQVAHQTVWVSVSFSHSLDLIKFTLPVILMLSFFTILRFFSRRGMVNRKKKNVCSKFVEKLVYSISPNKFFMWLKIFFN